MCVGEVTKMEPILIVDDEPQILTVLKRTLEAAGIPTERASSGGEAIRLVRQRAFSLLLTDQVMPGMMGIDLIHHAQSVRPEMKCLLMSGHPDAAEMMAELSDAHVFRFMHKPWKREGLLATVYAALGSAKLDLGPPSQPDDGSAGGEVSCEVACVSRRLAMDKQARSRFSYCSGLERSSAAETEEQEQRGLGGFVRRMFEQPERKELVQ